MSISFFHVASKYDEATEVIVENARKHHPDSYYFLGVDGTDKSYKEVAEKYNCDYVPYAKKLGPPVYPNGWNLEGTLEFLQRFYDSCSRSNSSHIVMMEDDVLIMKPVTVEQEWEHAAADTKIGNVIPEFVHDLIEQHCGKRPTFKQYGAGGGSIFNAKTFLENYDRVIKFFEDHSEHIMHNLYPTFGWIDCFMVIYYMLCGKDYQRNPYLIDTNTHHNNFDFDGFVNNLSPEIQIVNNYKKFYYE